MTDKKLNITNEDLILLEDSDVLLRKVNIIKKIERLLENSKLELINFLNNSDFNLPEQIDLNKAKISKGESYKDLPYLVLDFPAFFSNEDIFAYRTMFWWGNFFSSTLHLQGYFLDKYREKIIDNIDFLYNKDIYICVNNTPWQYNFEDDNYELLNNKHYNFISKCRFLKLSKKIELKEWKEIPSFSKNYFKQILSIINE